MTGLGGPADGQTAPPPDDAEDVQPALDAPEGSDPGSPVVVLPALVDELDRLAAQRPPSGDSGSPGRLKQAAARPSGPSWSTPTAPPIS